MSAPQDNDQPVSDPQQEPVRTFDLESGEVSADETPTRDPEGSEDPAVVEVQPPPQNDATHSHPSTQLAPAKAGWLGRIMRPRNRREQQLQTLQSGYLEMLEMMRSIRTHLDQQVQTQEKLVESLQHFPDAVEGLKNIGEATAQQTEVLGMVREQLEQTADHEEEIVGSMNNFNKTLNQMDETSRNSTQTVSDLMQQSRDSEAALRAMMERSEKRMSTLTGLMGFLALAAVGFALYVVFDDKVGAPPHDAAPITAIDKPPADVAPPVDDATVVDEPEVEEPEIEEADALLEPAGESEEVTEEAPETAQEPAMEPETIEEPVEAELEPAMEPEVIEEAIIAEVVAIAEPDVMEEATEEPGSEEGAEEMLDGEITDTEPPPEEESVTVLDVIQAPEEAAAEIEEAVEEEAEAVIEEAAEEEAEAIIEEAVEEEAEAVIEEATPDEIEEPAEDVEEEATEAEEDVISLEEEETADRPGVKGVVRRVFSFLGNEAEAETEVVEPVVGDLTETIEIAEQTKPAE